MTLGTQGRQEGARVGMEWSGRKKKKRKGLKEGVPTFTTSDIVRFEREASGERWHNVLGRMGQVEALQTWSPDPLVVEPDHQTLVNDSSHSPLWENVTFIFITCRSPVARPAFGRVRASQF